ncbi:MAG: TIGR02452 family protein [Myxococcota bacterium]
MKLRDVAQETLAILDAGTYRSPAGRTCVVGAAQAAAVEGSRLFRPDELRALVEATPAGSGRPARTAVWEARTQDAARWLVEEGHRVVLLNFASARNPGGGFLSGARSQEEDLARCSGLYRCLVRQNEFYRQNRQTTSKLYTDHLIYSPDVPFFRDTAYTLLEAPFVASVISCPAPNAGRHGRKRRGGREEVKAVLRRRADAILAVAHAYHHRTLLLGAWGCGVFKNDPADVAAAFGDILNGTAFTGAFDDVIFAIVDPGRRQPILQAFTERFGPITRRQGAT